MTRKVTRRNSRRRSTRVARRSTRRSTRRSARRSTRRVARRSTRALKRSIRKNVRRSTRRSTRRKNVKRSSRRSTRRSNRRRNMRKEIMVGGMEVEVDMTEKHCKKLPHYELTPEMAHKIENFLQEAGVTRDEPMDGGSNDGGEDEEESFDIIPRVPLSVEQQWDRYEKMKNAGYMDWNRDTDSQVVKRAQSIFAEGSKLIIGCVFYLKPELLGCVTKAIVATAFSKIQTAIQAIIYVLLGIVSGTLTSVTGIGMALFSGINAIAQRVGEMPPTAAATLQAASRGGKRMNDTLVSVLYHQIVETFKSLVGSAQTFTNIFDKLGILLTSNYINNFYVFPGKEKNGNGEEGIVNAPLEATVIVNIDNVNKAGIELAQWDWDSNPVPPPPKQQREIPLFDKNVWNKRRAGSQPKYNNIYLINFGIFDPSITGVDPHIARSYIQTVYKIGDQFGQVLGKKMKKGRGEEAEAEAGDEEAAPKRQETTPFSHLLSGYQPLENDQTDRVTNMAEDEDDGDL